MRSRNTVAGVDADEGNKHRVTGADAEGIKRRRGQGTGKTWHPKLPSDAGHDIRRRSQVAFRKLPSDAGHR